MKPSSQPILRLARRLPRPTLLLGALGLWLCLGSSPAGATTLLAMDLPTLSGRADRVLLGTVEKVESHYLGDSRSYIVTDVTIRCERELLGVPAGSRFVVRHLGGSVGELGQRVHGEAAYRVGEQVLLFASQRGGDYYALGMAQGAMHVYRDERGIARVDVQLGEGELVAPSGQPLAASPAGRTLDEVLAQVQSLLQSRAAATKPSVAPQPASHSPSRGGQP